MLKELYIENLAVIEKAAISFDENLNIFTGETGAGKSILIGGITAVTGGRITKDIVRHGAEKGVVTALFLDLPTSVTKKLAEQGFDCSDDELLIEREIRADGKGVARINGKVVTVGILREIAADLIDIHGQHDSRLLMNSDHHREILDEYGKYSDKIDEYKQLFKEFSSISRRIKALELDKSQKDIKIEILRHKVDEVDKLELQKGDEQRIAQELEVARESAQLIKAAAGVSLSLEGDDEVVGAIGKVHDSLELLRSVRSDSSEKLIARLESVEIELGDIASEVDRLLPFDGDGVDINTLEEKMSAILSAKRRYAMDIDTLIDECEGWKEELGELENADDIIEQLRETKKSIGDRLKQVGGELTQLRTETANQLAEKMSHELAYLDMPDVRIIFDVSADKVTINGMDKVEIMISVNKGELPKPISKIASGGELSRIMLAIKCCLSENDDIPTMIFDEIDTGISGRAASKVGVKLAELGHRRQVLCVTHLAQIAAKASNHLLIEKTSDGSRTYTNVKSLDNEGRKTELARIISGDDMDESAVKAAEGLLNSIK